MGLASRGTLCTFHTRYRYIQSRYLGIGRIWEEVLAELRCFGGSCWFCLRHGGFPGILADSKVTELLDHTEHTVVELADATLDQKMCQQFTQLFLAGEHCGCGEEMMAGLFYACPAYSQMGARRLPRTLRGLETLAASHT